MRILIATGVYPPESGGPATYTKLLEEKLPARGFEVRVLPFAKVRYLPKILRHIAYFLKCLRAARGASVVYAQDTVSVGFPAALAAMLMGKKFVVRVPGDYAWEQARQRFGVNDELDAFQEKSYGLRVGILRAVQKFVIRQARAVVVPSEYMKNIVSGWGVKPVRIYNGIDLPVAFELPVKRPEGFLIVSFGRDVPWKGFEGLRRVALREPGWALKIFSELPRIQAMGWLKAADVFVINSTYEGLSHQLLEAMALGVPVIATRVGGNPEVVDGCGMLIPPNDDESLYAALKTVFNNPELARAAATQANERVKQFDVSVTVQDLVRLLKTI